MNKNIYQIPFIACFALSPTEGFSSFQPEPRQPLSFQTFTTQREESTDDENYKTRILQPGELEFLQDFNECEFVFQSPNTTPPPIMLPPESAHAVPGGYVSPLPLICPIPMSMPKRPWRFQGSQEPAVSNDLLFYNKYMFRPEASAPKEAQFFEVPTVPHTMTAYHEDMCRPILSKHPHNLQRPSAYQSDFSFKQHRFVPKIPTVSYSKLTKDERKKLDDLIKEKPDIKGKELYKYAQANNMKLDESSAKSYISAKRQARKRQALKRKMN